MPVRIAAGTVIPRWVLWAVDHERTGKICSTSGARAAEPTEEDSRDRPGRGIVEIAVGHSSHPKPSNPSDTGIGDVIVQYWIYCHAFNCAKCGQMTRMILLAHSSTATMGQLAPHMHCWGTRIALHRWLQRP